MEEHFCQLHNCKFYKNEKNGKTWYSHKKADGTGYCNEPKDAVVSPAPQQPTQTEAKFGNLVGGAPKPEPAKPVYKDDKNSAFALSYAKDLAVAAVIPKEDILSWAEAFKRYLNGDLGVTDSQVLKVIMADKVVKK